MGKKKRRPSASAPAPAPIVTPAAVVAPRWERARWLAISAVAGILWFLSCAKFDLWPLAWFASVPALFALERASTNKRAMLFGLMTGTVANAGGFYWITNLLERFGHIPLVLAVPLYLLMCAYQGTVFLLFAYVTRKIRQSTKLPMVVVAPLVMVTFELAIPFLFPWYLAITQAWQIHVIQIADLAGPLGVTALLMVGNGAIYDLASTHGKRWRPALAGGLVIAAALGYGELRIRQADARAAAAPKVNVGLVQGNVAFDEKGYENPKLAEGQLEALRQRSKELEQAGAELVVWTESAYPYLLSRKADRESLLHGMHSHMVGPESSRQRETVFSVPLLFGVITAEPLPDGHVDPRFDPYNSAIMMDTDGMFTGRFDKIFLVLFSEHIPFSDTFPWLKKIFPRASGNFARGKEVVTFPLHTKEGDFQLGPMICFEDILPAAGRALGALHPDLLVNITNDAWFGDTSEPWEHMALSVYRAVEERTELVRAVNTGVSAFIDSAGRVMGKTYAVDPAYHPRDADKILGRVSMLRGGDTVYAAIGDLFAYVCAAMTAFLWLLLPRWRARKRTKKR